MFAYAAKAFLTSISYCASVLRRLPPRCGRAVNSRWGETSVGRNGARGSQLTGLFDRNFSLCIAGDDIKQTLDDCGVDRGDIVVFFAVDCHVEQTRLGDATALSTHTSNSVYPCAVVGNYAVKRHLCPTWLWVSRSDAGVMATTAV